jgi:hypothetical protein
VISCPKQLVLVSFSLGKPIAPAPGATPFPKDFCGLLPPPTNLPPPQKSFVYLDFTWVVAEWQQFSQNIFL